MEENMLDEARKRLRRALENRWFLSMKIKTRTRGHIMNSRCLMAGEHVIPIAKHVSGNAVNIGANNF
jgi:hypothetical protein